MQYWGQRWTTKITKKELPKPPEVFASPPRLFSNSLLLSWSTSALRGGAEPWQGLVKVLPHMSNELAICGMIGRFKSDDNWIQRGHVLLQVP